MATIEAVRQRDTFVADAGIYSAYQELVWRLDNVIDTYVDFTLQVGSGKVYNSRIYVVDGNADFRVSRQLGDLKDNPNQVLPLSVQGLVSPFTISLSATTTLGTTNISISVFDAMRAPDSFIHTKEFLTVQPEKLVYDPRFEGGLHHYGVRTIEAKTGIGIFGFSSVSTSISYISLRNTIGTVSAAATVAPLALYLSPREGADGVVISGFGASRLDTLSIPNCTIYGDTEILDVAVDGASLTIAAGGWFSGMELRNASNVLLFSVEFSSGYTGASGRLGYCSANGIPLRSDTGSWGHEPIDSMLKYIEYGGERVTDTVTGALICYLANNEDLTNIKDTNPEIFD